MIDDVKVFQRNPIACLNKVDYCRACGCLLRPADMATRLVIQIKSIAFTPLVCRPCGRQDDQSLIHGLIEQAKKRLTQAGTLATDYLRRLAAINTEPQKGE